ncbi:HNH endonuclease signature motif containing protein [Jiangella gansuensis]|uniref:HNH endonuclease signature motif containing protein n=1 Tax=Jiangella gansuensis TaxID=281473 RepID=UPI00047B36AD|nr:HNH endonuclease signature motif containing protein [Jiangella gansuensis]
MFGNGGLGGSLRDADPAAAGLVACDPRTGAWVSFDPDELPDGDADVAGGVLPDGVLDDALIALLDDDAAVDDDAADGDVDGRVPVEGVSPGPELAEVLAAVQVRAVSTYDVVEAVAGWGRLISWAQAQQAAALAELTARPELQPERCGYRSVNPVTNTAVEVAARTVTTARQAENLIGHAVQLVQDFPATQQALAGGLIDERRAKVITGELGGQDEQVRRRVDAAVLPVAAALDSVALRRRTQQLLHELAPVQTEQRCREARERRDVTITPAADAMAYLQAFLPAEDAMAVKTVLDAAAGTLKRGDRGAGRQPVRTVAQCRADALAALAWAALDIQHIGPGPHPNPNPTPRGGPDPVVSTVPGTSATGMMHRLGCACRCDRGDDTPGTWLDLSPAGAGATPPPPDTAGPPGTGEAGASLPGVAGSSSSRGRVAIPLASAQGRAVAVQVTFAFGSLAGLSDEPAHLDGYGPIPAHIGRHLAAAGIWQWVGTDPASGRYLDHGHTRYRPTQALIDHVILRDRTCRTPGCHHPATRCDIDHVVAHAAGGPTTACNCQPLCRTHHLLKHRGRWRVQQQPDGTTVWTSPTGHTPTGNHPNQLAPPARPQNHPTTPTTMTPPATRATAPASHPIRTTRHRTDRVVSFHVCGIAPVWSRRCPRRSSLR